MKIIEKCLKKSFHILTKLFMCIVYMTTQKKNDKREPKNVIYSMYWWDTARYIVQEEESKIFFNFEWRREEWGEGAMQLKYSAFQINVRSLTISLSIEHELETLVHTTKQQQMNVCSEKHEEFTSFFLSWKMPATKTFSFLSLSHILPRRRCCVLMHENKNKNF